MQCGPHFAVEVKGGVGSKELGRLVSLVFEDRLDGFTYRLWSTCHVGIKCVSSPADAKADEGWELVNEDTPYYIAPLCEQVLKCLAGQKADLKHVRWRASTRWVDDVILLEVQLEPD